MLDALVRLAKRGKLPAKIFVAHLNHQLRGEESDGDEAFVRELASQLGVECFVERAAIAEAAKSEKQNLEATARQARYEFLSRVAQMCGARCVLTAHTRDDQAETILMRLLRGSGAEGLRGIHAVRQLSESVTLIRPMLGVARAEVIEHCGLHRLHFRIDSSNYLPNFTRNRVRQELLPLLQSFNPRTNEALSRTAELLTDDQDALHHLAVRALTRAKQGAGLDAKQLREQAAAIRRRVLRLWLQEERGSLKRIEAVHLGAIEQLLLRNHGGRVVELPGNWKVRLKANYLTITFDQGEMS